MSRQEFAGETGNDPSLRAELRAEAARHRPDRAAMLARLERGRAAAGVAGSQRRAAPRRSGFRTVSGALAALVATGLGAAATWAVVGQSSAPTVVRVVDPASRLPSAPAPASPGVASTQPSPDGTGGSTVPSDTSTPEEPASKVRAGAGPAPAPSPSASAGTATGRPHTQVQDGYLWSDGSVDPHSNTFWAQSNITLKTSRPLTSLQVELRVALTPGVQSTGSWSTIPAADVDITLGQQNGMLVYRFVLRSGVTLTPGSYEFAGQYNHAGGGRDAGKDTYAATTGAGGSPARVWGDFYPTH